MSEALDNLIGKWTSLGAGFNAKPSAEAIDLERLVLDTARHASGMARLFIMAATWLHLYGDMLAKHRLKRLIRDELEAEYQPILGLLLESAQQGAHAPEFQSILKRLKPAERARPLFESARRNDKLADLTRRRASAVSRKWKLWCQPIELKGDAIRPASWMLARHPRLRMCADFRGDMRASILAALRHDAGAGQSEQCLAKLAGGSRAQVHSAVHDLEMTGRVSTRKAEGANRREVSLAAAR